MAINLDDLPGEVQRLRKRVDDEFEVLLPGGLARFVVTAIAWDGRTFKPAESWRLPRRQDTRHTASAPDPATPGALEAAMS